MKNSRALALRDIERAAQGANGRDKTLFLMAVVDVLSERTGNRAACKRILAGFGCELDGAAETLDRIYGGQNETPD